MLSKKQYKRKILLKKIFIILFLLFTLTIILLFFEKKFFINKSEIKLNKNKEIKKIYFQLPYIYDPKAVLKAKYLNLSNYPSYQLIKCIIDNKCEDNNLLITAYIYKNANKTFCNNLENNIRINNKKFYIENLKDVKKVCKVFYLIKEHKLKKKSVLMLLSQQFAQLILSMEK